MIFLGILVLMGCRSTLITSSGEEIKPFAGTIVYKVEVEQNVDTSYEKNKKALFGDQMSLTVFKNGDIQRTYNGASTKGYDLLYIDVEENQILEKYNNSDSLYVIDAIAPNMTKLNDLRVTNEKVELLNYPLKQVAIGAQELSTEGGMGKYLTIKYWYAEGLKVDKSKYAKVNKDLWAYFLNESDGSLYLKYEIDYFTYKVTYTAVDILPGEFKKSEDKIGKDVPRIEQ